MRTTTCILRMPTLAPLGRIGEREVQHEAARLLRNRARMRGPGEAPAAETLAREAPRAPRLLGERATQFDHHELARLEVILDIYEGARHATEAARRLFATPSGMATTSTRSRRSSAAPTSR
jgi:sigma54-dependent transcription regulator